MTRAEILAKIEYFNAELQQCLSECQGCHTEGENWGILRWEMDVRLSLWRLEDDLTRMDEMDAAA